MPSEPLAALDDYRDYLRLIARVQIDSRLQSKLDASDLVQQTLLRAHASADRFERRSEPELLAWLRRILANCLADEVRRYTSGKRDIQLEQSLEKSAEQSAARLDRLLAADQSSPSQRASREEQVRRLAECLSRLPPEQRRAVELRHLQGLSLAEIGRAMDRTEVAVGGLLRRGLDHLRQTMGAG